MHPNPLIEMSLALGLVLLAQGLTRAYHLVRWWLAARPPAR